jgi:hypothetical protein
MSFTKLTLNSCIDTIVSKELYQLYFHINNKYLHKTLHSVYMSIFYNYITFTRVKSMETDTMDFFFFYVLLNLIDAVHVFQVGYHTLHFHQPIYKKYAQVH